MAALVSEEVAADLGSEKRYGIWWFNRERHVLKHVAENGTDGKVYRRRARRTPRPTTEWVAVPVPNSGIPREWVDAARDSLARNKRTSKNGGRFWELSGGILRCAACGWGMKTKVVTAGKSTKRNHYYLCTKQDHYHVEACPNRKVHRTDRVEPRVWEFISGLLCDPDRLRAGLEEMVERGERLGDQADPDRERELLAAKIAEVECKRPRYQDMAAEGHMTFDELGEKLQQLDEVREAAERELTGLEHRRMQLEELERDSSSVVERYTGIVPGALEGLTPEERHRVYRMLELEARVHQDGTLELSGMLADPPVC